MIDNNLPPELKELETALGAAPCRPAEGLRDRVLARVRRELSHSRRTDFWQYAAAVAAAVLLMLNVGLSAAKSSPSLSLGRDGEQVQGLYEEARQMQLGLPDEELKRQCLLMAAGGDLMPLGAPRGSFYGTSNAAVE